MKAIYRTILISSCIIAFVQVSLAQENHSITLSVDTEQIAAGNLATTSNFGQAEGITNENFVWEVSLGDTIKWNGAPREIQTSQVVIMSINHESGTNLLGANQLTPRVEAPGIVVGVVTDGEPEDVQKYSVTFMILNSNGATRGPFTIDPKLRVKN